MARYLALFALIFGCSDRTEIVVGVATDLRAKGQIDRVTFVASRDGKSIIEHEWPLADLPAGQYELPGSFGLYSPDGAEIGVDLKLKGFLGDQLVTERDSLIHLVSGKTLFMRMGLVSGCSQLNGPICASNESCIEGVCRAAEENAHRFPSYRKELVNHTACNSGTHFIVSNSGDIMPSLGDSCGTGEYCQEGTCYKLLPGEDNSVGQGLWVHQLAPTSYLLHGMWGTPDGQDVFSVGEGGTILHLSGGAMMAASGWADETLEHDYTLNGVWGTAADDVFAVGTGGVILHRTTTGWAHETAPPVEKLSAVYGVGSEVWAVGRDQGQAVVLIRGATGWTRGPTLTGPPLRGLWSKGPDDVFVAGLGGTAQHWDGMAFTALSQFGTDLYGIFGTETDVWVAGNDGFVARWNGPAEDAGVTSDLFAVWASGPDDIYVAGDYGAILHKTGGVWTRQPSSTNEPLFALWGTGSDNVFAAGRNGVVLHTTGKVVELPDLAMPSVPPDDMAVGPVDMNQADLTPAVFINLGHINADSGDFEDYEPRNLTINAGTWVIWQWPANDLGLQNQHTVNSCLADAGAGTGCTGGQSDGRWCSGVPSPAPGTCTNNFPSPGPFVYQHKFDQPGIYDYFCKQHYTTYSFSTGQGEIIVK